MSSVPPVWPSPRPLIFPNGTPHAATIGATAIEVLSPTPPVECLSTTLRPSGETIDLPGVAWAARDPAPASVLDDPAELARRDPGDLLGEVAGAGGQARVALNWMLAGEFSKKGFP